MKEEEKQACLAHLRTSKASMLAVLENVSDKAFLYKSAPEVWSISEVLEHVIKVESGVINNLQQLGQATPSSQLDKPLSNDKVLELSANRKLKSKAREPFLPGGLFTNKEDAIVLFQQCRMESKHFIATNNLNMETIVFPHPRIGLLNGNQWLLFISGHSLKHVAQVKDLLHDYLFT